MPLMHFESIAQSLKEVADMLHEFCVIILGNAEMYFRRYTEHSVSYCYNMFVDLCN